MGTHTRGDAREADRSRAHIVVSRELIREVDELVGPRRRSEFFADAAREKLARMKLRRAAEQLGGSLAGVEIPGWESSESAAGWVRSLRRESEQRLAAGNEPTP